MKYYRYIRYNYLRLISHLFIMFNKSSAIRYGNHIFFKKIPHLFLVDGAKLVIGENTIINSDNYDYHLNMFSRCKMMVDTSGAEIIIGKNCRIHGTCLHARKSIIIGNNCLIAANTNIIDSNGHSLSMDFPQNRLVQRDEPKEIIIGDNVWIGANCIILGGAEIGNGSVIVAGSVVKSKVPPKCIFGGNPAQLLKQY